MKRTSVAALVVAAGLLLATAAGAITKDRMGGSLQGGVNNAGLGFTVHFKHGDPDYIDGLEWHNVQCTSYAGKQSWSVNVNDAGKFHTKNHDIQHGGGSKVTFTGRFKQHNKKVVGTLAIAPGTCPPDGTGTMNYTAN